MDGCEEVEVTNWGRKIRGILGLSVVGGTLGGILGAGWALVGGLLSYGWGFPPGNMVVGAVVWGSLGAFAAGGLGVALGAIGGSVTLEELPLWKVGLFGVAAGALFPSAILFLFSGTLLSIAFPLLASVSGLCAGMGGILTVAMVAAAKHGSDPQTGSPREAARLEPFDGE